MRDPGNYYPPTRDDDVAVWLKAKRDERNESGDYNAWCVIDQLLDEYRLRADCGYDLTGDPPTEGYYER